VIVVGTVELLKQAIHEILTNQRTSAFSLHLQEVLDK
jgi:hypothetical protein